LRHSHWHLMTLRGCVPLCPVSDSLPTSNC
jgi:hypothetical protein